MIGQILCNYRAELKSGGPDGLASEIRRANKNFSSYQLPRGE
jgi:hypothetical protein